MPYAQLVIVAALLQYFWFGWEVGRMRGKHSIAAPAISGHPEFERMFRIQQNTLELLILWVPGMMLAGQYQSDLKVALIGLLFVVGREIYRRSYLADPKGRSMGFGLSAASTLMLMVAVAYGAIRSLI